METVLILLILTVKISAYKYVLQSEILEYFLCQRTYNSEIIRNKESICLDITETTYFP